MKQEWLGGKGTDKKSDDFAFLCPPGGLPIERTYIFVRELSSGCGTHFAHMHYGPEAPGITMQRVSARCSDINAPAPLPLPKGILKCAFIPFPKTS